MIIIYSTLFIIITCYLIFIFDSTYIYNKKVKIKNENINIHTKPSLMKKTLINILYIGGIILTIKILWILIEYVPNLLKTLLNN